MKIERTKIMVIALLGILILGLVLILSIFSNAKSETWTQTTDDDFSKGENFFIDIDEGTLKLSRGLNCQWTALGESTSNYFGYSVASAGDVNGDGFDDVIVGTWRYTSNTGKAYLFQGSSTGLSTSADWTATGESSDNQFGRSVASAGDVNGDSFDDVIVGASNYNSVRGKAYLYYGSSSGLSISPDWNATGESDYNYYGESVAITIHITCRCYRKTKLTRTFSCCIPICNGSQSSRRTMIYVCFSCKTAISKSTYNHIIVTITIHISC